MAEAKNPFSVGMLIAEVSGLVTNRELARNIDRAIRVAVEATDEKWAQVAQELLDAENPTEKADAEAHLRALVGEVRKQ